MDKQTQARIFESYFTTKEEGKGTGLGLAMVYSIVKEAGGHIEVDSALGRGTTFKIYLPRVETPVCTQKPKDRAGAMPRGTETVLLVDGADDVRGLASSVLSEAGYKVLEARNGAEAVRLWKAQVPRLHLLITDVVMPELNGVELAKQFGRDRGSPKVLYMSGYADGSQGLLEEVGKNAHFLQKPFTAATLARKVREVLDECTIEGKCNGAT